MGEVNARSDIEEVDALPVLVAESESQMLAPRSVVPAVHTAAVAAGGFVAGAVVVRVLGRRRQRSGWRRAPTGVSVVANA